MVKLHFYIGLVFYSGLLLGIIELVRRKRLTRFFSVIWLVAGTSGLLLVLLYEAVFMKIVHRLGIKNPPTLLFCISFFFLSLIVMHLSIVITRLSNRSRRMAQKMTVLGGEIESAGSERKANDKSS